MDTVVKLVPSSSHGSFRAAWERQRVAACGLHMSLWIRASLGAAYANGANLRNLVTQMPPRCWQAGEDLGYMWMLADVSALGGDTERGHICGSAWDCVKNLLL